MPPPPELPVPPPPLPHGVSASDPPGDIPAAPAGGDSEAEAEHERQVREVARLEELKHRHLAFAEEAKRVHEIEQGRRRVVTQTQTVVVRNVSPLPLEFKARASAPFVLDALSAHMPGAVAEALADLSALARFDSLRRGVISLADLIYFLSLMGLGLGLAMALIDARRGGGR